jgi:transcriptional regulator with XRE-family HTH domain
MPQRRRELCRALAEAKAAGRTTADVAADAHIARATLSRIANGHRTPNRLTREAIARALDREVGEIFPGVDDA